MSTLHNYEIMKRLLSMIFLVCGLALVQACHANTQNTDKPVPAQAKDTATVWRDTSGTGTRTDR